MIGPKRIPDQLYRKIVEVMPVPCVDAIVVRGKRFLLGKRIHKPAKGQWFVIGGRVLRGESLEAGLCGATCLRKLAPAALRLINFWQRRRLFLGTAPKARPASHTINSVFLVKIAGGKLFLNSENKNLKWFTKIDKNWHLYVRNVLRLAGFE